MIHKWLIALISFKGLTSIICNVHKIMLPGVCSRHQPLFDLATLSFSSFKVLEGLGIMKNVKRFAGTSGGSVVAALASIGMSYDQLQEALDVDFENIFVGESVYLH